MMDGDLIEPKRPSARRGRRPMPFGIGQGADVAIGRFRPTPSGRGPFGRLVRRAALQTGRFAASTLLPAAQNVQRLIAIHHECRP